MPKKKLKKPDSSRTLMLKKLAIYEDLMGGHEAKTSGCKSKCPTKCASCQHG